MQHEVAFPVGVDKQLDDALPGPVVGDGARSPVENDVVVSDGEQVLAGVADLLSTAVLDKSDRKELCVWMCVSEYFVVNKVGNRLCRIFNCTTLP